MKISEITNKKAIPLAVEGVYIRDLPMKQFEAMFKDADKRLAEEDHTFVTDIFQHLVCDADGNPFEDLVDVNYETLTELLSINTMFAIIHAIPKAVVPEGVDLGN